MIFVRFRRLDLIWRGRPAEERGRLGTQMMLPQTATQRKPKYTAFRTEVTNQPEGRVYRRVHPPLICRAHCTASQ